MDDPKPMSTPLATVRLELEQGRVAGEPFLTAWQRAVEAVRGRERDEWKAALRSTAGAWARAYAGEPLTRREQAVALIATDLEPLTTNRCAHCRKRFDQPRKGRRKYCSTSCCKKA